MIYDRIENVGKYKGISKWFDYAADFLIKTDLDFLPLGRTEICKDHVFINVMEVDTVKEDTVFFETHKRYWDIQMNIKGIEKIQIGFEPQKVVEEFREDIDFGTFSCQKYAEFILEQGDFIVCMDGEPHKPTLSYDECIKIRKCVVKVEVDKYE